MIRLISGMEPSEMDLLGQMFEARRRLFAERLRWDVTVDERGWERDQYDKLQPLYIVSVDGAGRHQGSLRMLPTTGDTMLRDVFAEAFDGTVIESPFIWECTRFCVEAAPPGERTAAGLRRVTTALMLGSCEIALSAGVEHVVGVFDKRMIPIYKRGGWAPEIVGEARDAQDAPVYLGIWEVSEEIADSVRRAGGFHGSVLERASRGRASRLRVAA